MKEPEKMSEVTFERDCYRRRRRRRQRLADLLEGESHCRSSTQAQHHYLRRVIYAAPAMIAAKPAMTLTTHTLEAYGIGMRTPTHHTQQQ